MNINPLAGKPAIPSILVNVPKLVSAYYSNVPDASVPEQRVSFGTSGHRGSSFVNTFNERHILAITQAICLYRSQHNISGPLFLGRSDPWALDRPLRPSERLGSLSHDVLIVPQLFGGETNNRTTNGAHSDMMIP